MQLQSILFCVQFKSLIDGQAKQTFCWCFLRGFSWTCFFYSSNDFGFAFYDEVFLNFAYSESYLLKNSGPKNYEISKWRRYFVLNSMNICVGHAYKTGFNFLGLKNTAWVIVPVFRIIIDNYWQFLTTSYYAFRRGTNLFKV
jgi:hypothetical protein